MSENAQQVVSDKLRVGGRDGLVQFLASHPVDLHCQTGKTNTFSVSDVRAGAQRPIPAMNRSGCRYVFTHFTVSDFICAIPKSSACLNDCCVCRMGWSQPEPVRFEVAMSVKRKAEHATAEPVAVKFSAHDIFNHPRLATRLQQLTRWFNQERVFFMAEPRQIPHDAITLTRRAGVDSVKSRQIHGRSQCITLNERERITWLRFKVNANNLGEASAKVSHRCAPRTTEQIQQSFWWYSLIRQGVNLRNRFTNWLGSFSVSALCEPFA